MPNYAKVILMGHVGNDPELKQVGQNGKSMVRLSLAVNTGYGDNKEVSWYSVKCWGRTAEFAADNIRKGDHIFVEGEPTIDNWEDNDGNRRISVNVFCMKLLKLRWDDTPKASADPYHNDMQPAPKPEPVEDDLPF